MNKGKLNIILTLLLFCNIRAVHPQDTQSPEPPKLLYVSINPGTGKTTIEWSHSISPDVEFYRIYRDTTDYDTFFKIDSVQRSELPYYETSTTFGVKKCEKYKIEAIDSSGNGNSFSKFHRTILTSVEFDSCQAQLNISWRRYVGWINGVLKYNIYMSTNGSPPAKTGEMPGSLFNDTLNYVCPDIKEYTDYCFYIEAVNVDGRKSTSNKACKYTDMKIRPEYINADYATTIEGNIIYLSFTIDPDSEIDYYKLLRSSDLNGTYDTLETFTNKEKDLKLRDETADAASSVYYYKLAAINSCGNIAKISNPACNIVLSVANQGTMNTLRWNEYQSWNGGLEKYTIYRTIDDITTDLINTTNTEYVDDIQNFQNKQISGKFCYYIEATEGTNPYGIKGTSKSTEVCIALEPNFYLPNAINPKSEIEENRYFRPYFTFKPQNYSLVIYNRWGGVVFESNDISVGWDGKVKGGNLAPEGAYLYSIKLTNPDNKVTNKSGNLIVIYP